MCKNEGFNNVIVGMEPTGHYWKAFANFLLKQAKITVVLVNPYHTKKSKELDDNSQTKSDRKDATGNNLYETAILEYKKI